VDTTVIIVAVVAVVIVAVVILRLRGSSGGAEEPPAIAEAPSEPRAARAREEPEPAVSPKAEVAEAPAPEAELAPSPAPAEPAKPKPTEADVKARVESSLSDSNAMLQELKGHLPEAEGLAQQVGPGTLEIMEEGLAEVQGLADKRQWAQAKDKADALSAQLKLLLQTSRRE
jgi:hypothetical protein